MCAAIQWQKANRPTGSLFSNSNLHSDSVMISSTAHISIIILPFRQICLPVKPTVWGIRGRLHQERTISRVIPEQELKEQNERIEFYYQDYAYSPTQPLLCWRITINLLSLDCYCQLLELYTCIYCTTRCYKVELDRDLIATKQPIIQLIFHFF